MDAAQPFGYQPPAPGMHPTRMAALAAANGALQAQTGMVRSADEMEGGVDEMPPAKRQRVAKLPGGQLYPEEDWIAMHPVSPAFSVPISSKIADYMYGPSASDITQGAAAGRSVEARMEARWYSGHDTGLTPQSFRVDVA
jgi:hypothetical protein